MFHIEQGIVIRLDEHELIISQLRSYILGVLQDEFVPTEKKPNGEYGVPVQALKTAKTELVNTLIRAFWPGITYRIFQNLQTENTRSRIDFHKIRLNVMEGLFIIVHSNYLNTDIVY